MQGLQPAGAIQPVGAESQLGDRLDYEGLSGDPDLDGSVEDESHMLAQPVTPSATGPAAEALLPALEQAALSGASPTEDPSHSGNEPEDVDPGGVHVVYFALSGCSGVTVASTTSFRCSGCRDRQVGHDTGSCN